MKYLKYLVMLLVVSSITSLSGIKANSTDPYTWRRVVQGWNNHVISDVREKQDVHTQELRYTESENPLDVVLQDKNGNNVSGWYVLETGEDVIFSGDYAMLPGVKYRLYVDSRIHYFFPTEFHLKWWIH